MKPENTFNACRGIQELLKKESGEFYFATELYNNKHFLLRPVNKANNLLHYYVVFKKDFFWSFAEQFPEFALANPDLSHVGESINLHVLKSMVNYLSVDLLLFAYDSGKVYCVNPKKLLSFVERENLIRSQDKLNKCSGKVVETTASFPISILNRWGDL